MLFGRAAARAALAACLLGAASSAAAVTPRAARTLTPAAARHLLRPVLRAARRGRLDEALWRAQSLVQAYPKNPELATIAAILRQRSALRHLRRAQDLAADPPAAAVQYRLALAADPDNAAARRGLAAALNAPSPLRRDDLALRVRSAAPPLEPAFAPGVRDFSFRGHARALIGTVAEAYGLRAYVADSVPDRPVSLRAAGLTFPRAMNLLRSLLGVEWFALDAHTLYFGPKAQMADFTPLAERTFYLPGSPQTAETAQFAQLLRVIIAPFRVDVDPGEHALTVRARPEQLDAAEKLLLTLTHPPGQVLFEVRIIEADDTLARELGLAAPNQLQVLALGPILAQLSSSASLQQLLSQLFAQGGLNSLLGSGALSQELQQLESQLSPLANTPFAIFGGGLTAMALTLPPATLNLSASASRSTSLERAWLGAGDGEEASLKIGERYPIVNATFSPILLNSAIKGVLANGSYLQPFPSFTFEDLGLDLTLTPYLTGRGGVNLKIKAQDRALAGGNNNGMPILADRQLATVLHLRDGEPAIIAGLTQTQTTRVKTGLPLLDAIPLLGRLFSTHQLQRSTQRLLVVITPRVVASRELASAPIWVPAGAFARSAYAPLFRSYEPPRRF